MGQKMQFDSVLRVLVVDSKVLQSHALVLLASPRDVTYVDGREAALREFQERPYDIAFLAVAKSVLHTFVIAAHVRWIEREARPLRQRAAVIACTLNVDNDRDCLVAGSGLSGALNAPWSRKAVHACLSLWRSDKYLRAVPVTLTPPTSTDLPCHGAGIVSLASHNSMRLCRAIATKPAGARARSGRCTLYYAVAGSHASPQPMATCIRGEAFPLVLKNSRISARMKPRQVHILLVN